MSDPFAGTEAADITERLRAEIKRLQIDNANYGHHLELKQAEIERLKAVVLDLISNMGGHQHWDAKGTHGANCAACQRQWEASERARRALEQK